MPEKRDEQPVRVNERGIDRIAKICRLGEIQDGPGRKLQHVQIDPCDLMRDAVIAGGQIREYGEPGDKGRKRTGVVTNRQYDWEQQAKNNVMPQDHMQARQYDHIGDHQKHLEPGLFPF